MFTFSIGVLVFGTMVEAVLAVFIDVFELAALIAVASLLWLSTDVEVVGRL